MKKRLVTFLAGFILFSLCSCGSAPRILEEETDSADKMTVTDITVDSVYNFVESGVEKNPYDYTSNLTFHFNIKNDSEYISTSFSYTFNIVDSTEKNITSTPYTEHSGLLVLYPGDSITLTEQVISSETYEFTTLESYKIKDFKVEKAPSYSSSAIYSTEIDPTNEKYITVSDLTVRLVNDLSGSYLYRVDYKMSYNYENKDNLTIWLYYPRVVLNVDGKEITLSKDDKSYSENTLKSCYYFYTDETLDLEKPYHLSIKACIGTRDYSYHNDAFGYVVIGILVCTVAAPFIVGIIVLIVILSTNKKKKKEVK